MLSINLRSPSANSEIFAHASAAADSRLFDIAFSAARPGAAGGDIGERCRACPVRDLSLCQSLRLEELTELNCVAAKSRYGAGTSLFDQGSKDDSVHIVTSGMVRLTRILPDGRRSVAGFALPGDFIGLSFEDEHSTAAEALGPVSTCKIARTAFFDLIDRKPRLMRRLHAETARQLALAQDQMMMLGRLTARERTAAFLLNLRNRWQRVNGQSAHLALPMTRQDIADFLGLTMETVSRVINEFARGKLIVIVPDGVRVLDLHRLEAIVTG